MPGIFGKEVALKLFKWLYIAFLPLEIVGAIDRKDDTGREKAKTLSQWRQFVAQMSKPVSEDAPWWHHVISWRGLAAGTGLIDSVIVGNLIYTSVIIVFSPTIALTLAILFGVTLCVWLMPHFGFREIAS